MQRTKKKKKREKNKLQDTTSKVIKSTVATKCIIYKQNLQRLLEQ